MPASSSASQFGINVVLNYTQAYTSFGINCIVGGDIPNNYGSLSVVETVAPEGCILNVLHPAPVAMRHAIGHCLPDLVFGCLDQAMPGAVPAQSSASLWNPTFRGGEFAVDPNSVAAAGGNLRKFDVLELPCRRHGRPAEQGRAGRHRLPVRRAYHRRGDHREHFAADLLAQGIAPGHGRSRQAARRARATGWSSVRSTRLRSQSS